MLGETAKGKQPEFTVVEHQLSEQKSTLRVSTLTIRFSENVKDLSVVLPESVQHIKQLIRTMRPELSRRQLRIIHSGKPLHHGDTLPTPPTWLHCAIGPVIEPEDTYKVDDASHEQGPQLTPLRGFDRLRNSGFSREEISAIRESFSRWHDYSDSDYITRIDEADDERARALEDQWMDAGGREPEDSEEESRLQFMMVQGFLIGFFFPLIPFLFFNPPRLAAFWTNGALHPQPPSVVLSSLMQRCVVTGLATNLTFGFWRHLFET